MPEEEGVGKIVEVGRDVKEEVLHKVVSFPDGVGAWQEYCHANVDEIILLPALVPYNPACCKHFESTYSLCGY